MKNLCGKMRKQNQPYEVWKNNYGWEWRVLKKYQSPEKEALNPFARWMCYVTSPFCPQGEMGDTYLSDICEAGARKVS